MKIQTVFVVLSALWTVGSAAWAQPAKDVFDATRTRRGLFVVVAEDAKLAKELVEAQPVVVFIAAPTAKVEALRAELVTANLHGRVTVGSLQGGRLPLIDNLAAVVIDPAGKIDPEEAMRVVRPLGYLHAKKTAKQKPWTKGADNWGQYHYNAAMTDRSNDMVAGPARGIQWLGGDNSITPAKMGVRVVGAGRWCWPHNNMIAVKVRKSADYAGLQCPVWKGRREWFLLVGPKATWTDKGAKQYVTRHAFVPLDKLNNDYVLDWPGLEKLLSQSGAKREPKLGGFSGKDFFDGGMNPTSGIRSFGRACVQDAGKQGNLDTLTLTQVMFDDDCYGSYWNFWSPEKPNFFTDWKFEKMNVKTNQALIKEHTKGIRLTSDGAGSEFITVLYPGDKRPQIEAIDGGVRVGDDVITFGGGIDDVDTTAYVKVSRNRKAVVTLTGKDIDMDRSQGEVGLFVPDAGYPFGVIPDWLIRQRIKAPDWESDRVKAIRGE